MDSYHALLSIAEEQALSRSLPAALRIATTIPDEKWTSWIKLELMGYFDTNPEMKQDTVVPEYRETSGLWYDDYGRMLKLDNLDFAFINHIRLRQGVTELEGIAAAAGTLALREMDFAGVIRVNLGVEVSTFQFSPASVKQILTNIKVELLDRIAQQREKIKTLPEAQIAREADILQLKPTIYGVGIDLKALWRRMFGGGKR
jgi:hypothetical protein